MGSPNLFNRATRSCHFSEAAFHSAPQLDFDAPGGKAPNEPIGKSPLLFRLNMPYRSRPSEPLRPLSPSKSEMRLPRQPAPMNALRGLSKKMRIPPSPWCVRFRPSVPFPTAGSYGIPIFDKYSSRELFNVKEARTTVSAGWKNSSPFASVNWTPVARPFSCTMRRTQLPVRSWKLLCLRSTGIRVLVDCDFAPIMQPKREQ